MIAEREGDPLAFAERTVRGDVGYDSPEWIETFETIADLRASGVLLDGSGAVDYATMQQLFLQGKAATTYNGSWLLPDLLAATPVGPFDLHVAPPPLVDGASRPRPAPGLDRVRHAGRRGAESRQRPSPSSPYASEPAVDKAVVAGLQAYSPIAASNVAIENEVAQEFLPMFDDAITPMDWLWEPEITAEIDSQVQALVKGDTDARSAAGGPIEAAARGPSSRPVAATTHDEPTIGTGRHRWATGREATVGWHGQSAARHQVLRPEAAKRARAPSRS